MPLGSQRGTRLSHPVFGDGIVTSSPLLHVCMINNDEMERKFDPGQLEEFIQI